MTKHIPRITLCLCLLFPAAVAQEPPSALTPVTPQAETFTPPPTAEEAEDRDPVDVILEKLSLEQRIAQLMLVTPEGRNQPNTSDFGFMDKFPPGGVILRQILRPSDAFMYINKLRGLEAKTQIPLLVGADLYRLARRDRMAPSGFIQLPSLLALGAARHEESTRRVSAMMAEQMKAMGFDFYFGPSLALAPTVENAPGTIDTFGSDPLYAGTAGGVMIKVMQEYGLLSVPTGFPGGEFNHLPNSPAVLLTPPTVLAQEDLLPYRMALQQGVQMIHVGPTLVPTLDPSQLPACLSPAVMRLLRDQLEFEGVIIAGPLDTLDVTRTVDSMEAAVRALHAGADMLYWDEAGTLVMKAIAVIEKAVEDGRLSEEAINASVRRILTAKVAQRTGALAPQTEQDLEKLASKKDFERAAYDVERRALTLVQNHGYVLPLTEEGSMPIGITGTTELEGLRAALEKHIKPITMQRIGTARHLGSIQDFEIRRITSHIRGWRTIICVFTDAVDVKGQAQLVRELRDKGIRVIVVLLGYPGNLPELAEADAILLAYCDPATYAQTMVAVADTLVGQGAPSIVPAEASAIQYPGETRVYNAFELLRVPAGRLPVRLGEEFVPGRAVAYDPKPAIKKVEWDFGDGKRIKSERAEYAYEAPGHYDVTLTVTDMQGITTSEVFHVEVKPAP